MNRRRRKKTKPLRKKKRRKMGRKKRSKRRKSRAGTWIILRMMRLIGTFRWWRGAGNGAMGRREN
jgi:hypothetical protein